MGESTTKAVRRRLPRWMLFALMLPLFLAVWSLVALHRLQHREFAESQFAENGFRVVYEDRVKSEAPMWRRILFKIPGGLAFSRPQMLNAQQSDFNDNGAELIKLVPDLRLLWLWESQVTDAGLAGLPHMSRLESFSAPVGATEQGLVCLKNFPALKSLQLVSAKVSPATVDWILRLHRLEELDIRGATIDPKQLERLKSSDQKLRIQI